MPYSSEAEEGISTCPDTIKFLGFRKIVDMGRMLPEWHPVRGHTDVNILEGKVIARPNKRKHVGVRVSPGDFPLYHYTHDFTFNILPDSTPDNRYTNLLAWRIREGDIANGIQPDTFIQDHIHVEWETGLGANNKGNPCTELNKKGESCGFYTKGHQRGDMLWNWPTIGDWVHVEGLWIWDRGHPPSYTELHPLRFTAIRRQLPALIETETGNKVFATQIDIYAYGEGGALYNNRTDVPSYVKPVKMGGKNYNFTVKNLLPPPSANAKLVVRQVPHSGDNFTGAVETTTITETTGTALNINIAWKGLPDTLTFARTLYAYWDEGNGTSPSYNISTYEVKIESIKFKKRKEFISKRELRVFIEVGGQWYFLNEFSKRSDILKRAPKKVLKNLNQTFTVHVPDDVSFRVHVGGWEADGVDRVFGHLMDPYTVCTNETRKQIRKELKVMSPFKFRGCMDDAIGEVHDMHSTATLGSGKAFNTWADGNKTSDICLCQKGIQEKVFKLNYSVTKVD